MARAIAEIEKDIKQLTERDREELLRSLIAQLDGPPDVNAQESWRVESKRRLEEIEQGKAKVTPGPQVIEEARKAIK